jgi:DNA primase
MRIPEHIIEQIRHDTDIVEVISDFVALKKRGRNYLGLCPFHNEKTPSFNVLPEKGIFKCFGCGKGGDAITFIREHQKMSYVEAVKLLAERLGITLPEDAGEQSQSENNRYENAYNALRFAGNFFYKNLYGELGTDALDYVRMRGFSEETVKKFALGFAPDSFNATMTELQALGVSEEALVDAGLVGKKEETGRMYDRFRGRLMFPIQNPTGRVIGFGGRRMSDDDKSSAKYLNSPQSLVYNKSEVLYGIFQAKDALRKLEYGILVEGYADLLSVSQAGFQNVVASSGTALTKEQLRLLSRFCKCLKIVYDSDKAGVNAALRGLDLAVEEGFDVEIVRLPDGDDPDSIIQRDGADAFQHRLQSALSLVDFKGEIFREQGLLATPTGKVEAVRSMMETIAKVPDRIKRDFMIQSVAMRFALREEDLYEELTKILRRNQFSDAKERTRARVQEERQDAASDAPFETTEKTGEQAKLLRLEEKQPTEDRTNTGSSGVALERSNERFPQELAPAHAQQIFPEEEELLRLALTVEGACAYMKQKMGITEEFFLTAEAKTLFVIIDEAAHNGKPLETLLRLAAEGEDLHSSIAGLAIRRETPSERWRNFNVEIAEDLARMMRDCVHRVVMRTLDLELAVLHDHLKVAEIADDGDSLSVLWRQIHELDTKKRNVRALLVTH